MWNERPGKGVFDAFLHRHLRGAQCGEGGLAPAAEDAQQYAGDLFLAVGIRLQDLGFDLADVLALAQQRDVDLYHAR